MPVVYMAQSSVDAYNLNQSIVEKFFPFAILGSVAEGLYKSAFLVRFLNLTHLYLEEFLGCIVMVEMPCPNRSSKKRD